MPTLQVDQIGTIPIPQVDQTALSIPRAYYLKYALINLALWLLLFGVLFLIAYYMQEPSSVLEQRY
jgi:hypothetical protein